MYTYMWYGLEDDGSMIEKVLCVAEKALCKCVVCVCVCVCVHLRMSVCDWECVLGNSGGKVCV